MMRRTASEIIRELQVRVARLERSAAPMGATPSPLDKGVYIARNKKILVVGELEYPILHRNSVDMISIALHLGEAVEVDATGDAIAKMSESGLQNAMIQVAEKQWLKLSQALEEQNVRNQQAIDALMIKGRGRILKRDESAYVNHREMLVSPSDFKKAYAEKVGNLAEAIFIKRGQVFTITRG